MRPQQNARKWVDFEVDFEAYFESELKLTDEVAAKLSSLSLLFLLKSRTEMSNHEKSFQMRTRPKLFDRKYRRPSWCLGTVDDNGYDDVKLPKSCEQILA